MFLVSFLVSLFHVLFDVACFWIKKCIAIFVVRRKPILTDLYGLLSKAESYVEWSAIALRIDYLERKEDWKADPSSDLYDFELLSNRLVQFKAARKLEDVPAVSFLLRTCLSRNMGDMGCPALYAFCRIGTKHLIEEYNDEIVTAINWVSERMPESTAVELEEKLEFFSDLKHYLGNTALILSGGAALGMLPRIISGSSAGAIIASFLCTRNDTDLEDALNLQGINYNFFGEAPSDRSSLKSTIFHILSKLLRAVYTGSLFEEQVLLTAMKDNFGSLTFLDAFKITNRVLSITVSSTSNYEMPRLLNYVTAPNVLIWSAVTASCAMPTLFRSTVLYCRNADGVESVWSNDFKWLDGSIEGDVPRQRLSEMFNVNHFVVSQVNPHVYLMLKAQRTSNFFLSKFFFLAYSEVMHWLNQFESEGIFSNSVHKATCVIQQMYEGDITIIPDISLRDMLKAFSRTSSTFIRHAIRKGAKATWPHMSIIRNHCLAEQALDQRIVRLRKSRSGKSSDAPQDEIEGRVSELLGIKSKSRSSMLSCTSLLAAT